MPCYHPVQAYQLVSGDVVFVERGDVVRSLQLKCGQCVGCRLERSRQWAVRCMHEASLYENNCFVTLTYDDEHLPPLGSLRYRDFQLFMKRLRRRFSFARIRFYMCGEYGEEFGRPHFHACLFNFDFPDKEYLAKSPAGLRTYRSAALEELWPFGFSSIGAVTFESAAYVARYCMKKVTGDLAEDHYAVLDVSTGEIGARVAEFNRMSLRPGIGAEWLSRFHSDVYPEGMVVVNGVKARAPRYYDKKFEGADPDGYAEMLFRREGELDPGEQTDARLSVREQVAQARISQLKRGLK